MAPPASRATRGRPSPSNNYAEQQTSQEATMSEDQTGNESSRIVLSVEVTKAVAKGKDASERGADRFGCSHCNESFSTESDMFRHLALHKQNPVVTFTKNSESFLDASDDEDLSISVEHVTTKPSRGTVNKRNPTEEDDSKGYERGRSATRSRDIYGPKEALFRCPTCDYWFATEDDRSSHQAAIHNEGPFVVVDGAPAVSARTSNSAMDQTSKTAEKQPLTESQKSKSKQIDGEIEETTQSASSQEAELSDQPIDSLSVAPSERSSDHRNRSTPFDITNWGSRQQSTKIDVCCPTLFKNKVLLTRYRNGIERSVLRLQRKYRRNMSTIRRLLGRRIRIHVHPAISNSGTKRIETVTKTHITVEYHRSSCFRLVAMPPWLVEPRKRLLQR